jgi:hypothetical protein
MDIVNCCRSCSKASFNEVSQKITKYVYLPPTPSRRYCGGFRRCFYSCGRCCGAAVAAGTLRNTFQLGILPASGLCKNLQCPYCTVIRFVWICAKFGTCNAVRLNGTLVEDKMRRFKGDCAHFSFNKSPIQTQDGASAKFSTNSHEKDNRVA